VKHIGRNFWCQGSSLICRWNRKEVTQELKNILIEEIMRDCWMEEGNCWVESEMKMEVRVTCCIEKRVKKHQ
jgi:hypothetical protein